ncbi:MAG: hypothetical protein HAW63_03370 [Bdellovibrionaceae bacterium]|nr:hypothetical protein [Pseudobdellovibrionaceae bacterium]
MNSILKHTEVNSVIDQTSLLNSQGKSRNKKKLDSAVLLTSLIDAFSILVIYLLVNFNDGEALLIDPSIQLPNAVQASLPTRHTVIKLIKGEVFLENTKIKPGQLTSFLVKVQKKINGSDKNSEHSIIIQSDKAELYKNINSIVLASNHAGFSNIKFAVIQH